MGHGASVWRRFGEGDVKDQVLSSTEPWRLVRQKHHRGNLGCLCDNRLLRSCGETRVVVMGERRAVKVKFAICETGKLKMCSPSDANYLWLFVPRLQQLTAYTTPGSMGLGSHGLQPGKWEQRRLPSVREGCVGMPRPHVELSSGLRVGLLCIWLRQLC